MDNSLTLLNKEKKYGKIIQILKCFQENHEYIDDHNIKLLDERRNDIFKIIQAMKHFQYLRVFFNF